MKEPGALEGRRGKGGRGRGGQDLCSAVEGWRRGTEERDNEGPLFVHCCHIVILVYTDVTFVSRTLIIVRLQVTAPRGRVITCAGISLIVLFKRP